MEKLITKQTMPCLCMKSAKVKLFHQWEKTEKMCREPTNDFNLSSTAQHRVNADFKEERQGWEEGIKKWKCKKRERQDCEGREEKLEARCESIVMHLFLLYRLSLCINLAQWSLLKTSSVKRLHTLHDRLLQIKIQTSLQMTARGAHSHIKLTLKFKSSLIIAPICPSLFVFLSKRDLKQVIPFIPKLFFPFNLPTLPLFVLPCQPME